MPAEQKAGQGKPVTGTLDSSDLTTAAVITIYDPTDHTTISAIDSDEVLLIDWLLVITDTATAVRIFFKDDATPTNAGTVVNGGFAANGGVGAFSFPFSNPPRGRAGDELRAIAGAAGNVDIQFGGRIIKVITKTGPVGVPVHDAG